MALGCEAAREADPAQTCAPVFRARGVDCDDAGHDHGGLLATASSPMAGWTGEPWAGRTGRRAGCPIANVAAAAGGSPTSGPATSCAGKLAGGATAAYMSNNPWVGRPAVRNLVLGPRQRNGGLGRELRSGARACAGAGRRHGPLVALLRRRRRRRRRREVRRRELVMSGGLVAIGLTFTWASPSRRSRT